MIAIILGFLIGLFSASIGYGIDTWQFWLIAMPIVLLISILIGG